jgi:uncharacterized MAPEG superfamily protein
MNTDLTMLGASALLTALLASGKGVAMWTYWPVAEVLGNRDDPPALPAWAWRADRAHRNTLENFPHFAALVLLANVAGLASPLTAPRRHDLLLGSRGACRPLHLGNLAPPLDRVFRRAGELVILSQLI